MCIIAFKAYYIEAMLLGFFSLSQVSMSGPEHSDMVLGTSTLQFGQN